MPRKNHWKIVILTLLLVSLLTGCVPVRGIGLTVMPALPLFANPTGIELPEEEEGTAENENNPVGPALPDSEEAPEDSESVEEALPQVPAVLPVSEKRSFSSARTFRDLPPAIPNPTPLSPEVPDVTELTGKLESVEAFVYDVNAGDLIYATKRDTLLYPASTTKLLTILTALQYMDLDTEVTPGDELVLVRADSSIAGLTQKHTLTVEQLIEGLLLPSGNDAAYVLAVATGRTLAGDPELYFKDAINLMLEQMNRFASKIGMVNSHFARVDGYFDYQNYTTAEDMAQLAIVAYQNEIIRRYCGVAYDEVTIASGQTLKWTNSNMMLLANSAWYNPYVKGMKTGSLSDSHCLVAILEKEGQTYLVGVFGGKSKETRYRDISAIANALFGEQ